MFLKSAWYTLGTVKIRRVSVFVYRGIDCAPLASGQRQGSTSGFCIRQSAAANLAPGASRWSPRRRLKALPILLCRWFLVARVRCVRSSFSLFLPMQRAARRYPVAMFFAVAHNSPAVGVIQYGAGAALFDCSVASGVGCGHGVSLISSQPVFAAAPSCFSLFLMVFSFHR